MPVRGSWHYWTWNVCEKFCLRKKFSHVQTISHESFAIFLCMPVIHNQKMTMSIILFTRMDQCETVAILQPSAQVGFTYWYTLDESPLEFQNHKKLIVKSYRSAKWKLKVEWQSKSISSPTSVFLELLVITSQVQPKGGIDKGYSATWYDLLEKTATWLGSVTGRRKSFFLLFWR